MEQIQREYYYLFVNTQSGHQIGKRYLTIPNNKLTYITENKEVNIFLYDFFKQIGKQQALKDAKKQSQISPIHIVICGGDGTVVWVMSEVSNYGIDVQNVTFAVIPIGSGNDFARTLNWGYKPVQFDGQNIDNLLELLKKWQKSKQVEYDLWDVKIEAYEHGRILTHTQQLQNLQGRREIKHTFANYFGIGIDGRIAYTSQKNRSENIFLNRALYGIVGFFCFFNPAPSIKSLVQKFVNKQSFNIQQQQSPFDLEKNQSFIEELSSKKIHTSALLNQNQVEQKNIPLKSKWHTLVCLNGKNFMAGVKNIWKSGCNDKFHEQHFGDGKLQIVGFRNQLSLVLQRLINLADTVCQIQGQVQMTFKENKQQDIITYIQIDGEPMILINPKKIQVKHSAISKTGKINVLYNQSTQ